MCRIVTHAERGSQKWLQILINRHPDLIRTEFLKATGLPPALGIEWLSPLAHDEYAEYRDKCFVERLRVELPYVSLTSFWPERGPVWDGLGRSGEDHLIMIEAKSHIAEVASPGTSAVAETSIALIQDSLQKTKNFLAPSAKADWSQTFYQYTNRLAHLYLLREVNRLPAYLVNVYFFNDDEMGGPASREKWEGALELLKVYLGVRHTPLEKYVVDLFFDVKQLSAQVSGSGV